MLIGVIGKPNVGKSTFFKSATLSEVLIANYPFATIKPNHGIGYVKIDCIDKELNTQCNPREGFCINHIRFVPVELMDVAGLVPGASEGKGLGNQFLDDLRQADAFIHVIDLSGKTNAEGKPTSNYYPGDDIKFLEKEIDLWYSAILRKVWKTFSRTIESTKENFVQAVTKQFTGLKVTEDDVKRIILKLKLNVEHPTKWTEEDIFNFASCLRKETKPMIIAANKIDLEESHENLERIKKEFDYPIIACSADSELALKEASKAGLIEYIPGENNFKILKDLNPKQKLALDKIKKLLDEYKSTGVQDVLNYVVFDLLKYIAVFPAGANKLADSKGNILPDCYLMPGNTTALDFAFKLHTDLGNNFVKAIDVRTKKVVGKDHVLKNRDGIEILTR
jgi:hypothetical protein